MGKGGGLLGPIGGRGNANPNFTPNLLMVGSWAAQPIDGRTVFYLLSDSAPIDGRKPDVVDRFQKVVIRFARVML